MVPSILWEKDKRGQSISAEYINILKKMQVVGKAFNLNDISAHKHDNN